MRGEQGLTSHVGPFTSEIFFLFALSLLSSLSCVLHDFPPTPALTAATGPFAGPSQQPGNALAQPPPLPSPFSPFFQPLWPRYRPDLPFRHQASFPQFP